MNKKEALYRWVKKVPRGKVTTYSVVGKLAGLHPRTVGIYLHQNDNPLIIPCHRVVNSKGKLAAGYAFGGPADQARRLQKEGINIIYEGQVDLGKFLWKVLD